MTFTHAIIYTGAPYGDNESGHIVSRHKTEGNAWSAFDRRFSGTTGIYNHRVVAITETGDWNRHAPLTHHE